MAPGLASPTINLISDTISSQFIELQGDIVEKKCLLLNLAH
ncbi:hypothetical protein X874_3470 [Mannheimia varigena USDA-ARS-USMARC-1312]|nr:hypothetical protein X874_3470 [Mannheimia varigena USDA-ARS-USMARC-1312]